MLLDCTQVFSIPCKHRESLYANDTEFFFSQVVFSQAACLDQSFCPCALAGLQ
jgi:hypothetical protein